ncbi:MAG: MotA/TolQ/ExbB proton channel family protein [Candidatus Omnitrophota bacterium]
MKTKILQIGTFIVSCIIAVGLYLKVDIIQKGGPVMVPIILCSIFAFGIAVDRIMHLYRARIDTDKFMDEVTTALKRNKINDAVLICDATQGPISNIFKAGILKHNYPKSEIREAIEDAGLHEVPKLERNLSALATIAHVSPLLGLLGTVLGMVKCFQIIQQKAASFYPVSPADLAGGIWEALITTVAGLIVAIPAFVVYNYLVSRVDNFVLQMEVLVTDLLNILIQKQERYEV